MCEAAAAIGRSIRSVKPPAPNFSADQIPDLTGKVVIVTGSNTGIGKETVKALLSRNAKVYMAARSESKAAEAIADLKQLTGRDAIFLELDLGNLASVRKAAQEFLSKEAQLHILFNNAGVMTPPVSQITADGYDMQFGTNVLGHWYLTELLLPALANGAKSSSDGYARVVTTTSSAAHMGNVDLETLKDTPKRRKQSAMTLYSQSKLLNAIVAHESSKRYADQKVLAYACDPGFIRTDLLRHVSGVQKAVLGMLLSDASYGALTQLWAGTMPETVAHNGQYLVPYARLGRTRAAMYDPKLGKEVWEYCEEQVKLLK